MWPGWAEHVAGGMKMAEICHLEANEDDLDGREDKLQL